MWALLDTSAPSGPTSRNAACTSLNLSLKRFGLSLRSKNKLFHLWHVGSMSKMAPKENAQFRSRLEQIVSSFLGSWLTLTAKPPPGEGSFCYALSSMLCLSCVCLEISKQSFRVTLAFFGSSCCVGIVALAIGASECPSSVGTRPSWIGLVVCASLAPPSVRWSLLVSQDVRATRFGTHGPAYVIWQSVHQ